MKELYSKLARNKDALDLDNYTYTSENGTAIYRDNNILVEFVTFTDSSRRVDGKFAINFCLYIDNAKTTEEQNLWYTEIYNTKDDKYLPGKYQLVLDDISRNY